MSRWRGISRTGSGSVHRGGRARLAATGVTASAALMAGVLVAGVFGAGVLGVGPSALAAAARTSLTAAVHAAPSSAPREGPEPGKVRHRTPSSGGRYDAKDKVSPSAYPYAYAGQDVLDPWGETERQCVSYAAWWLNRHGVHFSVRTRGPSGIGDFLNADTWEAAARYAGWVVSSKPRVGSIAQWNADEKSTWTIGDTTYTMTAGPAGHVAVVIALEKNGLVKLAEYNGNGTRTFSTLIGRAPRYLYIGAPPA